MNRSINTAFGSDTLGYISATERVDKILKLKERVNNYASSVVENVKGTFADLLNKLSINSLKIKLQPIIHLVAKENNVDARLVNAVIEKESNFNPEAVSSSGALGLMQLMPQTAHSLGVKDPLNPIENIRAGTKYLSSLLNRYQGNVVLALSAYNAGPSNVDKYKGVPPFEETRIYVKEVMDRLT